MKVKRLIEQLQKMNPEATVYMHEQGGEECIYATTFYENGKPDPECLEVWLECENDLDMKEEINAMFRGFFEDGIDELDGYSLMLDIGITPKMVGKYIDLFAADHMEKFMEEHGL